MRIDVIGFGSRGDAQPLAALVRGLSRAGHAARLVTHANFEDLARAHGLSFAPLRADSRAIVESPAGREWLAGGTELRPFVSRFAALLSEGMELMLQDTWAATRDDPPDVIASNGSAMFAAVSIAERLDVPFARIDLQPTEPTRAFPATYAAPPPGWVRAVRGEGLYNLGTHFYGASSVWRGTRAASNRARAAVLDLPPWGPLAPLGTLRRRDWPVLCAFSEAVVPRPFEWDDHIHVTGYFALPASEGWTPPPPLAEFLASGPRPICVTFGSMLGPDPAATTAAVLGAIERLQRRAILVSGWGGLGEADLPPGVIRIDSAPFEWLFEHVSTVVHHAGAGTTAAALRAGRPAVTVPLYADQPFWARRVHELGAGTAPLPMPTLRADELAIAIEAAIMDPSIAAAAGRIGEQLRGEDGVGAAIRALEGLAGDQPSPDA